uniref:Si:dkey-16i5.8 n=1 Tax=Seriola dumerili TaxID=41447 RepID=A0A3B4TZ79_SERDU
RRLPPQACHSDGDGISDVCCRRTPLPAQVMGVGRCKCSFWFAVAHDILGVFIMMVGVFGGLVIHDLFIYAGAIIIFLSLIWWVFWYSGNIDVPPEELEDDVGMIKLKNKRLSRVVRRMSDRVSSARPQRRHGPGARLAGARCELKPQKGMNHVGVQLFSLDVTATGVWLSE